LKADEAVDQQTGAEGRYKAVLGGGKVCIRRGTGCSDAGVEDERYDGEEEVDVEKGSDFLATWACQSEPVANGPRVHNIPTAVNFERTWIIMTTVMIRARMCMKSLAAWKMSVLAISIVLE
jgi:hypothetical protein